jgi:release factor glutamine methyltransferase
MGMKIQTLRDIRSCLSRELQGVYPEPEINALANIIIKTLPEIKKLHQIYNPDQVLSAENVEYINSVIEELRTGKPIQYILGYTEFYNCRIRVTGATLIPRPETEELTDLVIKENSGYNGTIIDFGTGSGCIAIALAKNLPDSFVTGTDISDEAVQVAVSNAELNKVKVNFLREDIFNPVKLLSVRAGIIVSNPPYVRNSEKALMHKNVLNFEPSMALFVNDSEPLIYYKSILETAGRILLPGGKVYFEINEALGNEMAALLEEFKYSEKELVKDINGKTRFIKGKKND